MEKAGLFDKAKYVEKKLDGEGYDIRSYDTKGEEIHIEVKTTTKGLDEPFYMSLNETDFLKEHPHNYFLYRLYNCNPIKKTASFYILTGEQLLQKSFNATNYEVVIEEE